MDVSGIKNSAKLKLNLRDITLSELEKHDGSDPNVSNWTVLYGVVYDVSDWTSIHPGGTRMIRLVSGRDATPFIESYHHFNKMKHVSSIIKNKLNKNIVGKFNANKTEQEYTIIKKPPKCGKSEFYDTVCLRVDNYLKQNNISYHGYSPIFNAFDCILTLTLYFITAILSWYHTAYHTEYFFIIFHAMVCVRCGFLQHMANHRAYPFIVMNEFVGGFMDILGVDSNFWLLRHQIFHHIAPNVLGIDPDTIAGNPLARLHPSQPIRWYHTFQFIYIPFMIGFVTSQWYVAEVFVGVKLLLQRWGILNKNKKLFKEYGFHVNWNTFNGWNWIFGKLWVVFLHIVVKRWFVNDYEHTASWTLPVVCVNLYCLGFFLFGTFILNHNLPELFAETTESEDNMHWSELQVRNSSNWVSGSRFWSWCSGGLNHQIEHHLFPSMHHQNYPLIASIVQQTCKEFDLPYRNEETLLQCVINIEKYLYKMGRSVCVQLDKKRR